jgi:hypothetical protein
MYDVVKYVVFIQCIKWIDIVFPWSSQSIPIEFPKGSYSVLKEFPITFPIAFSKSSLL